MPPVIELTEKYSNLLRVSVRSAMARKVASIGPIPMVAVDGGRLSRCLLHVDYRRQEGWGWGDRV